MSKSQILEPKWTNRRFMIFSSQLFLAVLLGFIVYQDSDSILSLTIGTGAMLAFCANIGSYVFGASYENTSIRKMFKDKLVEKL